MQSTLGFAPLPEDLSDDLLFDEPVIAMRFPQPGLPPEDESEAGEP